MGFKLLHLVNRFCKKIHRLISMPCYAASLRGSGATGTRLKNGITRLEQAVTQMVLAAFVALPVRIVRIVTSDLADSMTLPIRPGAGNHRTLRPDQAIW